MKHATLDELQRVAAISERPTRELSRTERLKRWAELLERRAGQRISTLPGTEYEPPEIRARMQSPESALSIAFADPLLRADGLAGDTYGDAKRYFDLSDWQLHEVVCHCHFGGTMTAEAAARRVRSAISGSDRPGLMDRVRHLFAG